MSLLNDALRKRDKELDPDKKTVLMENDVTIEKTGKTKKYAVPVIFLLAIGLAVLWFWDVFFPSDTLLTNPPKIQHYGETPKMEITPHTIENPVDDPVLEKEKKTDKAIARVEKQAMSKSAQAIMPSKDLPKDTVALKTQQKTERPETDAQNNREKNLGGNDKPERLAADRSEAPFFDKARSYHRRGDLVKAVLMYREVLKKNPKHADARFNLASAYLEQRAFAEAYPILKKLYAADKKNPQILLNLAIAELEMGRPEQAIACLDEADTLKNKPEFEIFFHRGIARSRLSDLKKAEECYQRAEALDPGHMGLIFNLAVLYDKWQRYDKALKYYEAFLNADVNASGLDHKPIQKRVKLIRVHPGSRP